MGMRHIAVEILRGLTAAGVLLSAVVHLDMYSQGFGRIAVIGPLFMINVVAGLILGITVLIWRHWIPALLCAGFGAVTVLAYWISVIWGLFGVKEVVGGWAEILAATGEYVAVACGLAVALILLGPRARARRRARTQAAGPRTSGTQPAVAQSVGRRAAT